MTIYRWGQGSPIEKMEVQPFGKRLEAIVHARDGVEPAQLSAIRGMFHAVGVAVMPDEVEGKPVLRLRGFQNGEFLAKALESNGFAEEKERSTGPSEKKKEKGGFVSKIREQSFKISGWVYMIGDAALFISGMKRGDKNEAMSGLAYGATSVVAAGWGTRKPEKVFDDLYAKMIGEFARDGVKLPEGTELTAKELGKPGGLLSRIEKFFYDHPTQILTAGNAIAGYQLFQAGQNQGNNDKRIAGALVMTGMLIGLLVPEKGKKEAPKSLEEMAAALPEGADAGAVWKQPEMEKPKGLLGMLTSVRDWVQEKPLRVGGYMALGNNAFMIKGALAERNSHPLQQKYVAALKDGRFEEAETYKEGLSKYLVKADYGKLEKLGEDAAGVQTAFQQTQQHFSQTTSGQEKAIDGAKLHELDNRQKDLDTDLDARLKKLDKSEGMWKMNMLAAASYIVANGLLSISSTKGELKGKGGKDPNDELYAAAAAIIANQPEEVQDATITKIGTFLASQREIDMPANELIGRIREKVATVKDNPWLDPAKHGDRAGTRKMEADARVPDHVPDEWVQKEAMRNAAATEAGLTGANR